MYASIRVFEIVVYQINVLLFHPYKALIVLKKKVYKIQNPFRSVVLLGHNLLEVVFWFTAMTSYVYPTSDRLLIKIMDNMIRIFTLNYEKVVLEGSLIQLIFFFEVICGHYFFGKVYRRVTSYTFDKGKLEIYIKVRVNTKLTFDTLTI